MQNIFYTQEGKTYVLKTINRSLIGVVQAAPISVIPTIFINPDAANSASIANLPSSLEITTQKKIIPISVNLCIQSTVGVNLVDVSGVYFNYTNTATVGSINNTVAIRAMTKIIPMVQRIYYTSDFSYAYTVRYDRILFSEADFINPESSIYFYQPNIANCLISTVFAITGSAPSLPAGTYDSNYTVLYFELQS